MPLIPPAWGPSDPSATRAASSSATWRASTSVVVLTPAKAGMVVEVPVAEGADEVVEGTRRQPDVDDDAVGVEVRASERRLDDEGGAVQGLGRPERLAPQAVSHHHVVRDGHRVHAHASS